MKKKMALFYDKRMAIPTVITGFGIGLAFAGTPGAILGASAGALNGFQYKKIPMRKVKVPTVKILKRRR